MSYCIPYPVLVFLRSIQIVFARKFNSSTLYPHSFWRSIFRRKIPSKDKLNHCPPPPLSPENKRTKKTFWTDIVLGLILLKFYATMQETKMNIKIVFKEIQYLNTCFKFVEGLGIMQCILFSCFYQRFVIVIQIPGSV